MSFSWQNKNNSSPGFLYFKNSNDATSINSRQPPENTSDYLSFDDAAALPSPNFSPRNYSSPQSFQKSFSRKRPHYGGYKNNRYSFHNNQSFRSDRGSNSYEFDSYGYGTPKTTNKSMHHSQSQSSEKEYNIVDYIHESFLEDPWAKLEAAHKNKKTEQ